MTADDLACQELVQLVTDYHEGALAPGERARFEQHLAGCPFCVRFVEQIGEVIRLAGTIEPPPLTPDARQQLLDAFRHWHRPDR